MSARSSDERIAELERRLKWLESRAEPPLAGEFTDTAASPGDDLYVVTADWDDRGNRFGPVRWSPIGNALPQAGDEAVIVERSDGVWQVVAWWSDSQETGAAQSAVDALDGRADTLETSTSALAGRVDALEATRTVTGSVAADGSESSSGFSVVKNSTGDYTVTFTDTFAATPTVVLGTGGTAAAYLAKLHAGTAPSVSGFRVATIVPSTGAAIDGAFMFTATGPT